jgi:hypothetical protein
LHRKNPKKKQNNIILINLNLNPININNHKMNAMITILVISGLIGLAQSVCLQPPTIAELNQQLLNGYV